jgi:hypothetical protein
MAIAADQAESAAAVGDDEQAMAVVFDLQEAEAGERAR